MSLPGSLPRSLPQPVAGALVDAAPGSAVDDEAASPVRSRQRFFAFSAVGVAMVCVPLVQVLQYQNHDLQQLQSERALLDPVSQAVTTQHSLLAHRDLAGQVLSGHTQFEAERQFAQGDVDSQMASLSQVLTGGAWTFALAEARTLGDDWRSLAADVVQRRINAPQSHEAHALRLEQTLQVIDLVSVSHAPGEGGLPATRTAFAASARLLPRLVRETDRAAGQRPAAAATAAVPAPSAPSAPPATRLKALEAAIVGAAPGRLVPAFAAVVSTHQTHGDSLQRATHAAAAQPGAAQQAAAQAAAQAVAQMASAKTARQAQLRLFQAVRAEHEAALQTHIASVQQQRVALWALLGALGSVALGLGLTVLQGLVAPAPRAQQKPRSAAAATGHSDLLAEHNRPEPWAGQDHGLTAQLQDRLPDDPPPATAPSSRTEASSLLGRLRRGEGDAGDFKRQPKPRPAQRQNEHEDTLPP
jgi:hypothetical protein